MVNGMSTTAPKRHGSLAMARTRVGRTCGWLPAGSHPFAGGATPEPPPKESTDFFVHIGAFEVHVGGIRESWGDETRSNKRGSTLVACWGRPHKLS